MRYKNEDRMRQIIEFIDAYYSDHNSSPSVRKISEGIGLAKSAVQRYLVEMNDKGLLSYDGHSITTDKISMTAPGKNMAALVGTISCGEPLLEEENVEKYVPLPKEIFGDGDLYILRANGDSMIGAGIFADDVLVVDKSSEPENNDIVIAVIKEPLALISNCLFSFCLAHLSGILSGSLRVIVIEVRGQCYNDKVQYK